MNWSEKPFSLNIFLTIEFCRANSARLDVWVLFVTQTRHFFIFYTYVRIKWEFAFLNTVVVGLSSPGILKILMFKNLPYIVFISTLNCIQSGNPVVIILIIFSIFSVVPATWTEMSSLNLRYLRIFDSSFLMWIFLKNSNSWILNMISLPSGLPLKILLMF